MFPKPKSVLVPNSYAYESEPMVKATGFREYDARWLFGKEINLMGIQALGMGLARRSSPGTISAAIRPRSNTR
jgi:phosphomannomutase/phosphoglucomutase